MTQECIFNQAVGLGLQLLSALKHLHKRSLLHRDVAARNCYLSGSQLRLGDPALSRDLFPNDYHCLGHNENRPVGVVPRRFYTVPVVTENSIRVGIVSFHFPS